MGVLLAVIIIVVLLWPTIKRWLAQFMARRAEDFIRNATGMPPRPGSSRDKRERRQAERNGNSAGNRSRRQSAHGNSGSDEPLIPKEYAEDVEYTETVEYSETVIGDGKKSQTKVRIESQVSDAEWEEL